MIVRFTDCHQMSTVYQIPFENVMFQSGSIFRTSYSSKKDETAFFLDDFDSRRLLPRIRNNKRKGGTVYRFVYAK